MQAVLLSVVSCRVINMWRTPVVDLYFLSVRHSHLECGMTNEIMKPLKCNGHPQWLTATFVDIILCSLSLHQ